MMAANIVCYYNLAIKQGITVVLPVVINTIGERERKKMREKNRRKKLADCHTIKTLN